MKKEIQLLLEKFKEKHKNSKIRKNIAILLSCFVAIGTLYFLMLPAKTMNTVGEYKLYLKDKYSNELYSWKLENNYQTSVDLKLHYVDNDGNSINGKNIIIDIGDNYNDDIFAFGMIPTKEDGTKGKNIVSEFEIENIVVENGKYVFEHAEVYINDSWQVLSNSSNSSYLWCNNATSEVEPTEKDYGWYGIYETVDGNIKYQIDDKVEYKLVYSFVETPKENNEENENLDETIKIDDTTKKDETQKVDDTTKVDDTNKVDNITKKDDTTKVDDINKVDDTTKVDDTNKVVDTTKKDETTKIDDTGKKEETPGDNTTKKDETITTNETTQNSINSSNVTSDKKLLMKSPKSTPVSLSKENSVDSLDSTSGIKFGLYDYEGYDNTETYINANGLFGYFSFRDSTFTADANINPNVDADGFGANRTKVKSKLDATGNPVFDCQGYCPSSIKNTSLGYLFGQKKNAKGEDTVGVTSYSPKNTLLQKETIDNVDYYYYSSNSNAVDYDIVNQEFIVRNYRERGYTMTTFPNEQDRYEFLPFNYKVNASSPNGSYNYESATDTEEINHWYGMTMEFEFYMPKNGKINGKDMIFEFSGDDDVWVFIDNVLVLDLGGTHGAVDGSINFSTGAVNSFLNWDVPKGKEPTGPSYNTTIKKMFGDEPFEKNATGETFADYSKHTLKFFYLERGAAVANCKIRFNIPVLPAGSLSVQKQFEGVERYPDDYTFTIYDESNKPVKNATYTVGDDVRVTDENGNFTLKNTEVAIFVSKSNDNVSEDGNTVLEDGKYYLITKNKYYVKENSSKNAEISSCKLNNKNCSNSYTEEELTNKPDLKYQAIFTLNPDSKNETIFTNKTKTYNLVITKEAINSDKDELFDFKVSLKDGNGNVINLNELDYVLPNETLKKDNGVLTFKIKSTESITIKNIPIRSDVSIQELDHDGYHVSMKSIVNGKEYSLVESDTYTIKEITDNKAIKVYNTPGIMLPETGGPGISMYIVIGLSLIIISLKYGYSCFRNLEEGGE